MSSENVESRTGRSTVTSRTVSFDVRPLQRTFSPSTPSIASSPARYADDRGLDPHLVLPLASIVCGVSDRSYPSAAAGVFEDLSSRTGDGQETDALAGLQRLARPGSSSAG